MCQSFETLCRRALTPADMTLLVGARLGSVSARMELSAPVSFVLKSVMNFSHGQYAGSGPSVRFNLLPARSERWGYEPDVAIEGSKAGRLKVVSREQRDRDRRDSFWGIGNTSATLFDIWIDQ